MIGEKIITPGAIIQLVIKLRLTPPISGSTKPIAEDDVEQIFEFCFRKHDARSTTTVGAWRRRDARTTCSGS